MFTDNFDSFVDDFLGEKHERPLIIVGASKIDDLLMRILTKYLLPSKEKEEKDELLSGDNPLSTFSSRIKMTYRLGIIDEELFKILEQVRKIRNKCAHGIEFDIRSSPVREHLNELRKMVASRDSYKLTIERFFPKEKMTAMIELHCFLISICVILEAIHEKIIQTTGVLSALKISKK